MFTVVAMMTDGKRITGLVSRNRSAVIESAEQQWRENKGEIAQVIVVGDDGAVVFSRPESGVR